MFDHSFTFDPTYGYGLQDLLAVVPPAPPDDFVSFWDATRVAAERIAPHVERGPTSERSGVLVAEVAFDAWGGARVRGWLTLPAGRPATHGLVVGHGYGGRDGPDPEVSLGGAAAIFPCVRGRGLTAWPDGQTGRDREHVLVGIGSRETYGQRGVVADHWAAATALSRLAPEVEGRLGFLGSSFSGGLGAIAAAFDPRFRRVALNVPSYGHHPLRLTQPCRGSGEAVRRHAASHPETAGVLRYFDAAVAARFLDRPTLVGVAQFDPNVPPPGQAAVFNALPGRKSLYVRRAGHFAFPGEAEEQHDWRALCRAWFEPLHRPAD